MRVLRVIEPVRMKDDYDGGMQMPVVGSYVTYRDQPLPFLSKRRGLGQVKYALWTRHNDEWAWTWDWKQ